LSTAAPVRSEAACSPLVLLLAAAVARRHPDLAADISGTSLTGAPRLIKLWAERLDSDLGLGIHVRDYGNHAGALIVSTDARDPVYLGPAFKRANAALDGLGWRLIDCIDQLSGHNPVITPMDLFHRCSYTQWYEATTDAEFKKNRRDIDGIDEDSVEYDDDDRPGPDSYWKDFPGMPREEILGRAPHRRRRKWSARTCRRYAALVNDPWAKQLLEAMAEGALFARRHQRFVWHVQPNDADWEQCPVTYVLRWSKDDQMGHWLDLTYEDAWNGGMGTDATLVFECPSVRYHTADEIQGSLDQFVEVVEACSIHVPVMDKLFGVIADAGAKKCKSNSARVPSRRKG